MVHSGPWPGSTLVSSGQVKQALADHGELAGEVDEYPVVRHRPVRGQRVPGEHDVELRQ